MKKVFCIIAAITLIVALSIGFTACNSATVQGQLTPVWRPYEKFVYDVADSATGNTGIYTVEIIKKASGEEVTVGANTKTLSGDGYLVKGHLEIATAQFDTACLFSIVNGSAFLIPSASYRKEVVDGATRLDMSGLYDGAKFKYNATINGESKSGEVSLGATYYDNNQFHQVIRGASTLSSSFSFSFAVPVVADQEIANIVLTTAATGVENVTVPYGSDIECIKIGVSRSTKVAGISQQLFYSTKDLEGEGGNGWKVKNALVKIVEGDVTYSLKSIILA
ncbi:MAG: hypothetical protein MJ193_00440 [Clostridia bacterium]|nr:hypothetical protein [Clostridia bacterium]